MRLPILVTAYLCLVGIAHAETISLICTFKSESRAPDVINLWVDTERKEVTPLAKDPYSNLFMMKSNDAVVSPNGIQWSAYPDKTGYVFSVSRTSGQITITQPGGGGGSGMCEKDTATPMPKPLRPQQEAQFSAGCTDFDGAGTSVGNYVLNVDTSLKPGRVSIEKDGVVRTSEITAAVPGLIRFKSGQGETTLNLTTGFAMNLVTGGARPLGTGYSKCEPRAYEAAKQKF